MPFSMWPPKRNWLLLLLAVLLLGCGSGKTSGEKLPELVVTKGTLKKADGSAVNGGFVELRPEGSTATTTINSIVEAGGKFDLGTFTAGDRHSGAPPGRYQVTYLPEMGTNPEQQHQSQPIVLSEIVEIKSGQENSLSLVVP